MPVYIAPDEPILRMQELNLAANTTHVEINWLIFHGLLKPFYADGVKLFTKNDVKIAKYLCHLRRRYNMNASSLKVMLKIIDRLGNMQKKIEKLENANL